MDAIDKDKINEIILEASKGSSYYKREMERTHAAKEKAREHSKKIELYKKNEKLWQQASNNAK